MTALELDFAPAQRAAVCPTCGGAGVLPDQAPEPVSPAQQEPGQPADPFQSLLTEAERAANIRHLHELSRERVGVVKAALAAGAQA